MRYFSITSFASEEKAFNNSMTVTVRRTVSRRVLHSVFIPFNAPYY